VRDYRSVILSEFAYGGAADHYWPLSEVNGTSAQDVTGSTTGVYAGTYTSVRIGPINRSTGTAPEFDGASGRCIMGLPGWWDNRTQLSVEAWVRVVSNPTTSIGGIVGEHFVRETGLFVQRSAVPIFSTFRFSLFNPSSVRASIIGPDSIVGASTYSHLVGVLEPGSPATLRFYVNGASVGTASLGADRTGTFGGKVNVGCAENAAGTSRTFFLPGMVAEVTLWTYALTADRIRFHYEAGRLGPRYLLRRAA
jgi:hypothetical protein